MSTTNDNLTEALEQFDHALTQWAQSYPVRVFPEPDMERAHAALVAAGMTLDSISASNMRHVVTTLDREFESVRAALAAQQAPAEPSDAMVSRFLGWRLPDNFAPDAHISFDAESARKHTTSWPTGTNLFTAEQARAMFKHALAAQGENK